MHNKMLKIVISKCEKAEKEGTKSGVGTEMLENAVVQLSKVIKHSEKNCTFKGRP